MHKDNTQCHVYNIVQLLLRLSNDAEENPGPTINDIVDCSYTTHASFNQGNDLFGGNFKTVNIWNQATLNTIMVCGNNLYGIISESINKDYLLLTDVPEFVDMNNSTFHLQYSDSFSGALFMTVNNFLFVTLENALNEVFHSLNYKSCLLTIGMNTVAILMPFPDVFKVFDSHSRDLYGMPCMSGHCVLISVEGLQNLAQYFHLTSQSSGLNDNIPFELKGVTCVSIMNDNRESDLSDNSESVGSPEPENKQSECKRKISRYRNNNRRKIQRQNESPEEKKARLEKRQLQTKSAKKNESLQQREHRLAKARDYNDRRRIQKQNESPEEKKALLEKRQLQRKRTKKNESLEQRSIDFLKQEIIITGEKFKDKMNLLTKKARLEKRQLQRKSAKKNESLEQREHRLAKIKDYNNRRKMKRLNESPASSSQESLKQNENIVNDEPTDIQTLTESPIRNFHESVSIGTFKPAVCVKRMAEKFKNTPLYEIDTVHRHFEQND